MHATLLQTKQTKTKNNKRGGSKGTSKKTLTQSKSLVPEVAAPAQTEPKKHFDATRTMEPWSHEEVEKYVILDSLPRKRPTEVDAKQSAEMHTEEKDYRSAMTLCAEWGFLEMEQCLNILNVCGGFVGSSLQSFLRRTH